MTRCDKLMVCRKELVPEGSYWLTTARKDPLVCGMKILCNGSPFGHETSQYLLFFFKAASICRPRRNYWTSSGRRDGSNASSAKGVDRNRL